MRIAFGICELDTELFELRRHGQLRSIEPQVFDLLIYLLERRERIVSREELFEALWAGKVVAESTLNSSIKAARRAVGDDGRSQNYIATVSRRGYRFVASVDEPEGATTNEKGVAAALESKRASLAVMPFAHAQEDNDITWTAAMLGKDIGINLARIPGFTVVSPNSTLRYLGSTASAPQIGRELATDYLVEGSVREAGATLRISVQLIEASSGQVLWAGHTQFTKGSENDFQDEVVRNIVGRIEPELNRAELSTLRQRRPSDLGAWALYRQASAILGLKGWSEETFSEAADLLRLAIKRDPLLAFAHAYHALLLAIGHLVGLVNDEGWHEEAVAAAETAVELDSQDSDVLGYAGCAFADMGQLQRGLGMMKRAVELNPSNAQAHAGLGAAMLLRGELEGVELMRHGMRISPRDSRLGIWGALLARNLLSLGRVTEAIEAAEHACRCDDKIFLPRLVLAVAENTADEPERARAAIDDARRIRPQLSKADIARFASPEEIVALEGAGLF